MQLNSSSESGTVALDEASPVANSTACAGALVSQLAAYFGLRHSRNSLIVGLPLERGQAGFTQIPALARRAGLIATPIKGSLKALDALAFPVLLNMRDGQILLALSQADGNVQLLSAEGERAEQPLKELSKGFAGDGLSVHPALNRETRADYQAPKGNWLWRLVWSARGAYAQAAFGAGVVNVLALAVPFFVMAVYDRIIPNQAYESLLVLASGVLLLGLIDFSLRTARAHILDHSGRRLDTWMGNQVFNHVIHSKQLPQSSGGTANAIREMDVLREFMNSSTVALLADLPFLLVFIGAIYWIGGPIALVPALTIPVALLIFGLSQFPLHRTMKRAYLQAGHRNSVLFEVLNNMETVKGLGGHSWAASRWEKAHAAGVKTAFAGRFYMQMNQHLLMFLQTITTVLTLVVGVQLIGEGALSFGALFACVILVGRAIAPLSQISQVIGRLHAVLIAWESISGLMKAPLEKLEGGAAVGMPTIQGDVVFDQVDFAYAVPGSELKSQVLRELSFKIKAGEKVAIVGTIGSGKTSLLRLINHSASPDSGTVRVDSVDVREIHPGDLRNNIGYLPQNLHFFKGTLRENICVHRPDASDEDILKAAELAGVDQWLAACPLGLNQPVGERGDTLSGGQKQGLALARALLCEPSMLLMDEPTSQLDSQHELAFVARIKPALQDKTVVLVTHRPAALELVERIIVLDQGRVILDGPKQQVLDRLSGQSAGQSAGKTGAQR